MPVLFAGKGDQVLFIVANDAIDPAKEIVAHGPGLARQTDKGAKLPSLRFRQ